jgi:hypothetical protein
MLNLKNLKQTSLLLILSVVLDFSGFSQINLVPNAGFEDLIDCNLTYGQICKASPWFQPLSCVDNYDFCSCGSSDIFNYCSTNIATNIPPYFSGYQLPYEGNGYIGISILDDFFGDFNVGREYVEIKLKNELKKDKKYCISWKYNLANISQYGVNRIGCVFSKDTIKQYGELLNYINIEPNSEVKIINFDTLNWTLHKDIFLASGEEKYFTVGNFRDNSLVLKSEIINNNFGGAYYYFDDFGVYELPEISAGLGGEIDTLGENVGLQANCEGCWNDLVYRWWPSAGLSDTTILNPIATPEVTTTYYFGLIDTSETVPCIVDLVDSVTVFVTIPQDTVTPPPTSFSWLVYPSPTNGNVTVQFSTLEFDSQLLIIDARGRLVRKIAVPKNTESLPLDISPLAAGEYFLQVENEGLKEKRKIVKF